MRDKLTCPHCKEKFRFSFIRNSFSSKVVCPKCKKQLFVENRTLPYIFIAAILFLGIDTISQFVSRIGLQGAFANIAAFALLGGVCFLLMVLMKYGIGGSFLYEVRSKDYYEEKHHEVEQMKKQVKKKHKGKKK